MHSPVHTAAAIVIDGAPGSRTFVIIHPLSYIIHSGGDGGGGGVCVCVRARIHVHMDKNRC